MNSALQERKEAVQALYKSVLNRAADEGGLKHYVESKLSLEDIEKTLKDSLEYSRLHKKENFNKDVKAVGAKELLVMGSTPDRPEHLKMLAESNIGSVLCLDKSVAYPTEWCETFMHVPLAPDEPIPPESLISCLDFLHAAMLRGGDKIFIHSRRGVERAPLVLSLYLVATQNLTLEKALRVVASKRKEINPRKALVNSKVLECVYNYRDKVDNFPEVAPTDKKKKVQAATAGEIKDLSHSILVATDSLFLGTSVDNGQLEGLKEKGVRTIIDLNEKSLKFSSPLGSWFAHMKLPVKDDQIGRIIPIAVKTASKYMSRNPVYVVCENPVVLFMFVDAVSRSMEPGKINVEGIRKELLS